MCPLIKERNRLPLQSRCKSGCDEFLQRCRDARSNLKNDVEVVRGKWIEMRAEKIQT